MSAIEWIHECYYCGKEYERIAAAFKHRCNKRPRGLPLEYQPVFLLRVRRVN
jgi:hypothetical protein